MARLTRKGSKHVTAEQERFTTDEVRAFNDQVRDSTAALKATLRASIEELADLAHATLNEAEEPSELAVVAAAFNQAQKALNKAFAKLRG